MTTTSVKTLRLSMNRASPNEVADILRRIKFGNMLEPIKVTFASLTAAAAIDITTAASKAGATIVGGLTLATSELLPAIGQVVGLRVSASGTAGSLGAYIVSDSGATPIVPPGGAGAAVGIATLSDDGKTLTFPNTVTGFVLTYLPRAAVDMDSDFAPNV